MPIDDSNRPRRWMVQVHWEGPQEDLTRMLSLLQSQIDGARPEQLLDRHHEVLRMHKTRQPSPINLQPNDDLCLDRRMLGPRHALHPDDQPVDRLANRYLDR